MDPDVNLSEQLTLCAKHAVVGLSTDEVHRLVHLITSLNKWIQKGGVLPRRWRSPNLKPSHTFLSLYNVQRQNTNVKTLVDTVYSLTKVKPLIV